MQRIEQRLRLGMGLDAATIGSSSIQRAIRLRMKAAGTSSMDEYEQLLARSTAEWNQLVEAVVVTETWFFRDPQAFAALAKILLQDWLPANATGRARILSLPCSSGEEPYSIAMALLDAGIPDSRFAIDAVDLSQRVLEKAAAGIYGKNSFRGTDLAFRDRHFQPQDESYTINPAIRNCVQFRQDNLLGSEFSFRPSSYNFIFCRNLLIYFDRETQAQAFAKLDSLLIHGGTLFVGPAEVPLAMANGFSAANLPMAFACQRTAESTNGRRVAPPVKRAPTRRTLPVPTPPVAAIPKPAPPAQSPPPEWSLAKARELADSGNMEEAMHMCRAHLDQHGASVDAFYLLGVIHDSRGHAGAREYYRKALYLDPNHYESLLQMALLAEKEGDHDTARSCRRRAQRLEIQPG
jgi:chemotaxis protein methyltransferase WspC